jgi:hypothetical protein
MSQTNGFLFLYMVNFLGTVCLVFNSALSSPLGEENRPKRKLSQETYSNVRGFWSMYFRFSPFTIILRTYEKNCSAVLHFRHVAAFEGLQSTKDITGAVCLVYVFEGKYDWWRDSQNPIHKKKKASMELHF